METRELIALIDSVAKETGCKQSTVCGRACGDAWLYRRLLKREKHDSERAAKIAKYIRDWRRVRLSRAQE